MTRALQYLTKSGAYVLLEKFEDFEKLRAVANIPMLPINLFPSWVHFEGAKTYKYHTVEPKKAVVVKVSDLKVDEAVERVWHSHVHETPNDLSLLQFQLAVFSFTDYHIYKLAGIDYRGNRYDVSGDAMTKWLRMDASDLFNFCNEEQLDFYYNLYRDNLQDSRRAKTKEEIFTWLAATANRLSFITDPPKDDGSENLNSKREDKAM